MKDNQNNKTAQSWFTIAEDDLKYAKVGLKEDDFYALIAFHAQQAAEKYLKGYLVLQQQEPPRSHDLSQLVKLCEKIDSSFVEIKNEADLLSPFAVDTRYPVFYPSVEKQMAFEAVSAAEEIINFIKYKTQSS